jgi:hypothetical protein
MALVVGRYEALFTLRSPREILLTLNIFYCSKRQKDKTQVKQLRQSSPITYISKYTIEHNDI